MLSSPLETDKDVQQSVLCMLFNMRVNSGSTCVYRVSQHVAQHVAKHVSEFRSNVAAYHDPFTSHCLSSFATEASETSAVIIARELLGSTKSAAAFPADPTRSGCHLRHVSYSIGIPGNEELEVAGPVEVQLRADVYERNHLP